MTRQLTEEESEKAITALVDAEFTLKNARKGALPDVRRSIDATLIQIEEVLASLKSRGIHLT